MPTPEENKALKEKAIADARKLYDMYEANPKTRGKVKWDAIEARIKDPKRFEQFAKLYNNIQKREAQQKALDKVKEAFPELDAGGGTSLSRCLDLLMKPGDSKEAFEYNKAILQKYSTAEGRVEMTKRAMQNLERINLNTLVAFASSADNMIDLIVSDRLLVEHGFLAESMRRDFNEANISAEFDNIYSSTVTMHESMNMFATYEAFMGSAMNFFIEDPNKIPTIEEAELMRTACPPKKGDQFEKASTGIVVCANCAKDFETMKSWVMNNEDLDCSKSFYELKAVDKDGKEVPWREASKRKDVTIQEKGEKEIKKPDYNSLTVNEKQAKMLAERPEKVRKLNAFKKDVKQKADSLVDLLDTHNSKKAPGFFSRLFNTKYNKAYNKESEEIKAKCGELKELGVRDDVLDLLVTAKNKEKQNVAYNYVFEDTIKEYRNRERKAMQARQQTTIKEADNSATTKQHVVGPDAKVNTAQKEMVKQGPSNG